MPQFDSYENAPGQLAAGGFTDGGFLETYGTQIEVAANEDETDEQKERREKFAVMAQALAWVLQHCWLGPNGRTREARAAFKRFVAITMTMRPDLLGNISFEAMARKLRFTKSALSKLSLDFSDKAGLHFRRSRLETARAKFAEVQRQVWAKRRAGKQQVNGAPHHNGKPERRHR